MSPDSNTHRCQRQRDVTHFSHGFTLRCYHLHWEQELSSRVILSQYFTERRAVVLEDTDAPSGMQLPHRLSGTAEKKLEPFFIIIHIFSNWLQQKDTPMFRSYSPHNQQRRLLMVLFCGKAQEQDLIFPLFPKAPSPWANYNINKCPHKGSRDIYLLL